MMIAFKCRHALKVYMPNKPTKWGYKLWCRAGVSGYVYAFEVSGGLLRGLPKDYQVEYDPKESKCVALKSDKDGEVMIGKWWDSKGA